MENQNQTVVTQKNLLPVIELFKKSFDAYWKKIWTLAGITLFSLLGILALLPSILIILIINFSQPKNSFPGITLILVYVLLILIGAFFCILIGLWSQTSLYYAVNEDSAGVKQSLATAWKKIASFFWVSLLVSLAVFGGFILLIIPGIIFSVWFTFSVFVFICEGLKGSSALKRSKQLVQGHWWPVFGRIIVLSIIVLLISWIKFFGPIINMFFVAPFSIVFMYTLYKDLVGAKG